MNVYLPNLRLPSTYQEVEYIQSDASNVQYINTGYLPTSNPKIELDFMYINGIETTDYVWFDIYGRRGSTNSTYIGMYINNPNGYVSPNYAGFDPGQNSGVTISKNTRYYHIQDSGQFYLNGTKYANASTTNTLATANYPVFLFGNNMQGTVQGREKSMRVYSCKMWNDGVLVRYFIPCYRKSDSVIGLYDLVNNQFYTNSGTGTFSKGNDVTIAELKNAYIGEVYEYSYDFRGKSSTQLTNDGWSVGSGTTIDSNGITSSSFSSTTHEIGPSITNAKKITLTCGLYNANAMNSSYGLWGTKSSGGTHYAVFYIDGYTSDSSALSFDGANVQVFTQTEPSGQSEWTYTLDFENLTYNLVYSGVTKSGTMTQTQANNVRNNNTAIRLAAQYGTGRIQYVKILVE